MTSGEPTISTSLSSACAPGGEKSPRASSVLLMEDEVDAITRASSILLLVVDAKTVDVEGLVLFNKVGMRSLYQKEFLFDSSTIFNDLKNEHEDNDSILIVA